MTVARIGVVICSFLLIAGTAPADRPVGSAEQQLLALDDQEREMVLNGDAEHMSELAHPELHINAPTNEVLDRTEFLRRLSKKIIAFENHRRIPEEVYITGNVGVIMGREVVLPAAGSESDDLYGRRELTRRYTNIYIREDGRWRFLARHANVVSPAAPQPAAR